MIKYRLVCNEGHEFEGWFQNSAAYDAQAARGQVSCPHCGTASVEKAIMAPSVATRSADVSKPAVPEHFPAEQLHRLMRKIRDEVRAGAEYVGPRFAEEARKIHMEESPARGIYGEASLDEAKSLAEDGIPFMPLPHLPDELN